MLKGALKINAKIDAIFAASQRSYFSCLKPLEMMSSPDPDVAKYPYYFMEYCPDYARQWNMPEFIS